MRGIGRAGLLLAVVMIFVGQGAFVERAHGAEAQPGGPPQWQAPAEYSVDMVMRRGADTVVLKRFTKSGLSRMEMTVAGHNFVMIERPDRNVVYVVMPTMPGQEKSYVEQKRPKVDEAASGSGPAGSIRHLGPDAVGGRPCEKYELTFDGRTALYWTDRETNAPVRVQDDEMSVDWQNYRIEPQPAALFEPPPGYQRFVMPDIQVMMGHMAAQTALGMTGGIAAQAAGQGLAAAGAALGGPVGAVVGQMVGQYAANWLVNKAQQSLTPAGMPRAPVRP